MADCFVLAKSRNIISVILATAPLLFVMLGCSGLTPREKYVLKATGEPEPRDRIAAVNSLSEIEAPGVREQIESVLKNDQNPAVRAVAAGRLSDIGERRSFGALLQALKSDEDPVVRVSAIKALKKLGILSTDIGCESFIESLKEDPSPAVRAQCAGLLGSANCPEAVPPLVTALGDYDSAVKIAAHRSLVRITGRKGLPPVRESWEVELKRNP